MEEGRRWLPAIGALLLFGIGHLVPMPGLDRSAWPEGAMELGIGATPPTLFALGFTWLVLFRGAAALVSAVLPDLKRFANPAALVCYLVLSTLSAAEVIASLEHFDQGVPFRGLVVEPGWSFRLLAGLTLVSGAALAWWLARVITNSLVAHGALLFAGIEQLGGLPHALYDAGAVAGYSLTSPLLPALSLLHALPLVVILAGLALWAPRQWPVPVAGDLRILSSADLLMTPLVIVGFLVQPLRRIGPVLDRGGFGDPELQWLGVGASAAAAGLVAACLVGWWSSREAVERRLRVVPLLPVPLVLLFPLLIFGAGYLSTGEPLPWERHRGPWTGEAAVELVIASRDGGNEADIERLVARLSHLGVQSRGSYEGQGRAVLTLNGYNPEAFSLPDLLAPHRLGIHMVPPHCTNLPDEALPPCLETPLLTGADLRRADVVHTPYGPAVSIHLTPEGAVRFGEATGAAVGRKAAIVLDGEVLSAPVIQERIDGGRVQITMGAGSSDAVEFSRVLASSLRVGALDGTWVVEEQRAPGR